jgi:hypothetical protein
MTLRLSNTTAIKVHQMRNLLSGGSHHLIVYKNDDPAAVEKTTPERCTPFAGALNLSGKVAPVMITQKAEDALTLPDRVAYTFAPNQLIRIEMHFINSTDAPIEVSATSEFYAVPDSEIDHEANILFIGTPDIDIPAGATMDVQTYFTPSRAQLDLGAAKFFAITGHTHHHGLNECSYHNTSNQRVSFGESANDEMCFFWAYYYPSKGSHVCVHTSQFGGLDICCPEAGDICNQISDMLEDP